LQGADAQALAGGLHQGAVRRRGRPPEGCVEAAKATHTIPKEDLFAMWAL
jgi:hypothetical protein